MKKNLIIFILFYFAFITGCSNKCTDPDPYATGDGQLEGTVTSAADHAKTLFPAFIFLNDSLIATTDASGSFSISALPSGIQSLICSALWYMDATHEVIIQAGETSVFDFSLTSDSSTAKFYAEVHDQTHYDSTLAENPDMEYWNEQEAFEGVTGATIQVLTFPEPLPRREIFLADSALKVTDDYGQVWVRLQQGTYPITMKVEGYESQTKTVKVVADAKSYMNYYLSRTD